jgi:two-component system LytT family sensor kinase
MMHEDISAADKMLSRLSDVLRLTLESIGKHEVSLAQELEFVRKYLEIERLRFQERLALELDVAPHTLDALVPNMILQPLVENSIRHGFGASRKTGTIQIQVKQDGDELVLRLTDNGKGFSANVVDEPLHGLGLVNARRRLEQLYSSRHQLECSDSPAGGAVVLIAIPFHTARLSQSIMATELSSDENARVDRRRRAVGAKADRYAPQS